MNFLLKIVRGPNAGAEIALVEGLCISMGKAGNCDILLADPTLPDEPLQIETAADSVVLTAPGTGREHLSPFHAVTFGSTSFAVGPADAAWEPIVWPDEGTKAGPAEEAPAPAPAAAAPAGAAPGQPAPKAGGKKSRLLSAIAAAFALLVLLALASLLLRGCSQPGGSRDAPPPDRETEEAATLEALVAKHALAETNRQGKTVYVRNFATRAERLAATGELYAAQPGICLDFSDDESFRTAAEDLVFTLTEGALSVAEATNRVLTLSGTAPDAAWLTATLDAFSRDLPYLDRVVCDGVRWASGPLSPDGDGTAGAATPALAAAAAAKTPVHPICGILATPYPCLVLRNGQRILEGGMLGDAVVERIEPDGITLATPNGRMAWHP